MSLSKNEKDYYKHKHYLGYWSCLGIVELKEIEFGIEDMAVVSYPGGVSRLRIDYGAKRSPFIRLKGQRLYFDECIMH